MTHVRLSPAWYASALSWEARSLGPWLLCVGSESPEERWLLTRDGKPLDVAGGPPGATRALEELLLAGMLERRDDGALGWSWEAWGLIQGLSRGALRQRRWRATRPVHAPARPAPVVTPPAPPPPTPRVIPGFLPVPPPVRVAPPPEEYVEPATSAEVERVKEALLYGRVLADGTMSKPPRPLGCPQIRPMPSKLFELVSRGYSAEDILDAIWGLAEMIERKDADPVEWWRASRIFSGFFDELAVMVTTWRAGREAKAAARLESAVPAAANEPPAALGGLDIARLLEGTAYRPGGRDAAD